MRRLRPKSKQSARRRYSFFFFLSPNVASPPRLLVMASSSATASSESSSSMSGSKVRCVLVGDGAVGKTSLVVSYTTNGYPHEYVPTAMDRYDVVVHVDNEPVTLEMCDTPGQAEFQHLRRLCYSDAHVFILCFSVMDPDSLSSARRVWAPEIRRHCDHNDDGKKRRRSRRGNRESLVPPIVLVGTQSDLRSDAESLLLLAETKRAPVSAEEARKVAANLGCVGYVETSSVTQKQLKELFDVAITQGLLFGRKRRQLEEEERRKEERHREEGSSRRCVLL